MGAGHRARSVTAVMATATVAEAHAWERAGKVGIELWADGADLPDSLSAQLVEQASAHPALHPFYEIVVCLPRRSGGLLSQVLRFVDGATTRAAGMTSLIEGAGSPGTASRPGPPAR